MIKDSQTGLYYKEYFNEFLTLEKKRCKRLKDDGLLMLADLSDYTEEIDRRKIAQSMMYAFSGVIRDTDVKGWYVDGLIIGVIFTEMTRKEATSKLSQRYVVSKCLSCLKSSLGLEAFSRIQIHWQPPYSERIHKISPSGKVGSKKLQI
jgi:hypothetical protein